MGHLGYVKIGNGPREGKGDEVGSETADNPESIYNEVGNEERSKSKTNKQTFKNKRAQYYWRMRDRFYATYRAVTKGEYIDPEQLISLSSDIKDMDSLRAEICRIPKKQNRNGMIQIMSKQDMLKMDIPSPNMSDSIMMAMFIPDIMQDNIDIQFDSLWN